MQQFVHISLPISPYREPRTDPLMSRQLTISSLFSAFALVTLALFARAGSYGDVHAGQGDLVVQVHAVGDLTH